MILAHTYKCIIDSFTQFLFNVFIGAMEGMGDVEVQDDSTCTFMLHKGKLSTVCVPTCHCCWCINTWIGVMYKFRAVCKNR